MADNTLGSSASAFSAHPELSIHDGTVTTTSLQVEKFFGKPHRDVLRAIRTLTTEMPEDHARNFARMVHVVEIGSGASREEEAICMTREGFMLLAMGFTGKEARDGSWPTSPPSTAWRPSFKSPPMTPPASSWPTAWPPKPPRKLRRPCSTPSPPAATASGAACFGYDRDGQTTIPQAQVVDDDQMVTSLNALVQHITKHDVIPSDAQLAALVTACAHQLSERAQVRAATKASAAPATTSTSTAVAAPMPPHIGHDGKPLPPAPSAPCLCEGTSRC